MRHAFITRGILALSWPILLGQLAGMAYGVVDTIMSGHSSSADLAALGLGASVYASLFLTLSGVVSALHPIIAQHYGARREAAVGASYVQGLWLCLVLSVVGLPVLAFPGFWVAYIHPASDVAELVSRYLRILSFSLPAALAFRAMGAFNTAVSRPRVVMLLALFGLVLKTALNGIFIFGRLGLPRLGVAGCAVASLVAVWTALAIGWAYIYFDASYRRFAIRWAWPQLAAMKEQLHLGVPMGVSFALEYTSFTFMALVIVPLGTNVMGGQQIIMNLVGICYQIPFSLAVATATLTAQALGAGDTMGARKTAFTGIRIGLAVAVLTASTVWVFRGAIIGLYTNDPAVASVAFSLIGYLVGFHLFDALQGITGYVLRAYKVVVVPTLIYGATLWCLGLIGGYFVAFYPVLGVPRGAPGMWLMQAVALFLASLLLLSLYFRLLKRQRAAASPA